MEKIIANTGADLGNGGFTMTVIDSKFGPKLRIQSSFFGNMNQNIEMYITETVINKLADMFKTASEYAEYGKPYVHAYDE